MTRMHRNSSASPRVRQSVLLFAVGAILCGYGTLSAQSKTLPRLPIKSASTMLAQLEKSGVNSGPSGAVLGVVLQEQQQYPRTTIDSIVTGLERIALKSNSRDARQSAASALASAGSANQPIDRALDRVVNIYSQSDDPVVRLTILNQMSRQKDRRAAIAFLKKVAVEGPKQQDYPHASLTAVSELAHMGAEGRAALTELRTAGAITDSRARGYTQWFLGDQ